MSRPPRKFQPRASEVEKRLLLSARIGPHISPREDYVGFSGPALTGQPQVALQQDGQATVNVYRQVPHREGSHAAPVQVVVATDPSSPAVGVNVGAVRQTITLDNDHTTVPVTVPILAGAPNPGAVDVSLTITPVNAPRNVKIGGPLDLKVLASSDNLVPQVTSVQGTPQGVVLTFNKPMDPAGASNVKNYTVHAKSKPSSSSSTTAGNFSPTAILSSVFKHLKSGSSTSLVKVRSAQYDPAAHTVTLVSKRPLDYNAFTYTVSVGESAKGAGRRGGHASPNAGLTDQIGTPLSGRGEFAVKRP